jgi:hypothetical protein
MTEPHHLNLDVTLRDVSRDDLRRLEWFGLLTRFRASFDDRNSVPCRRDE